MTTANGTSAVSAADQYLFVSFDLVVVNYDGTYNTYSIAQLQGMTAVSGYGGFLNSYPSFKGPWSFTGMSVLSLLPGLPAGQGIPGHGLDAYVQTFTYDQVKNNAFTMYNPTSNPSSPTIIGPGDITGSLQMIVAYQQSGASIPADAGPLRLAFVSPVSGQQATDSVNWVKMVVKIEGTLIGRR